MKFWTTKEETFLKENYGRMSAAELAEHLDRTPASVKLKLSRLNLKRPTPEYKIYKGKTLVASGTANECAEKLGIPKKYISWMANKGYQARCVNK